jgi:hypothetical protein
MDKTHQAELKRLYKESTPPSGVYRIRNDATGRIFIGSSVNVNARINRHRSSLFFGSEEIPGLQSDWRAYGPERITFEVLDVLDGEYDSDDARKEDLRLLERMWREKSARNGETFYGDPVFRPEVSANPPVPER